MICYKQITPQELADQGKNFNWGNHFCNNCKRNMWGHGLVPKYFSHLQFPIFLKRYRCPDCSVVVTMRPESYWSYLRTSTLIIFMALRYRINELKWPWYVGRQVGGHWLKRLVRHAQMELATDLVFYLDNCFLKNIYFFP